MISNGCIEVQTSPLARPSVPAWFAEVVMIAGHLATKGLLEAFAQQVRLVRGRFGSYEPIDFLGPLVGYAISGERTLADFFERVAPFESAFMALFGRRYLPHRSSLSRFLADVDRPCLEVFRTLFEQQTFADGWTSETIGGIFDRQGRRYLVFDIDATRQAARQRALPCDPTLPPANRRLDEVCAPGHPGRKRGEVVRTRTTALQMHTRQWVGTYAGKGNGDYRAELASALRAITDYLKHSSAFPPEMALVRLDGAYGDATVIAQLLLAGTSFVTRWRGYLLLEHPQIQRVLAHAPTASMTRMNSGQVVEVFDGGWLALGEGLSPVRVMVARHSAPAPGKDIPVGKRVGDWVYELFITTLSADGFLVEDVLDLYQGRGADRGQCWPMRMSKKIPIAGVPTPSVGKNSGKSPANGCGTCAFPSGRRCKESRCARSSGPRLKKLLRSSLLKTPHRKNMAHGSGPQRSDEPRGVSGQRTSSYKRMENSVAQPEPACG